MPLYQEVHVKRYGPSKSTIYLVLSLITVEVFVAKVSEWIEQYLAHLIPQDDELEGMAIDGKTLRGSRKQGASNTHLLGALSHRLGLIVAQLGVDDKTNEIGAMAEFLAGLVIEGRVFTMDALLTQREVAQTIIDGGGDYVMTVKENQPQLYADLEELFAEPGVEPFIHDEVTTVSLVTAWNPTLSARCPASRRQTFALILQREFSLMKSISSSNFANARHVTVSAPP